MQIGLGIGLGACRGTAAGGGAVDWVTTVEGLRSGATVNGRTSGAALKIPGTDTQSGFSWNAGTKTMTITQSVILSITDWDFTNCAVVIGANTNIWSFTQCLFGESSPQSLATEYLSGGNTSTIRLLDYCTFTGPQNHRGNGVMVQCGIFGPDDGNQTVFSINKIYRCRFLNATGDVVKAGGSSHYNGQRMEYCYIGPPRNLIAAPVAWSSLTVYAINDMILGADGIRLYMSLQNANLNNTPPVHPTTSTAWWNLLDIHGDAVTLPICINRFSMRYCLIDWTNDPPGADGPYTNTWGVNNNIRWNRNSSAALAPCGQTLQEYNLYYHSFTNSPPVSIGTTRDDPQIMRYVRIEANDAGNHFYPVTTSGDLNYQIAVLDVETLATLALQTGASATDLAATPANTVLPSLSGTATVGAVLTGARGTHTGWPQPFYTPTLEVSANGTTGWTTVANFDADTMLYTFVSGDATKYFRLVVAAENSTATISTNSAVFGPVAAGYVQNFVNTNATGALSVNTTAIGSASKFELSMWLKPQAFAANTKIWRVSAGMDIFVNGSGVLSITLLNSTGTTTVYTATSPSNALVLTTRQHLYIGADWSTGSGSVEVRVNGVAITMTPTVGPLAGDNLLRTSRTYGILCTIGGAVFNTHVSDFWAHFHSGTMTGYAALYNSGTPPDPTALGVTPYILLGGTMRADDDNASNAANGWNDGYDLGSGATIVGSATFTNA